MPLSLASLSTIPIIISFPSIQFNHNRRAPPSLRGGAAALFHAPPLVPPSAPYLTSISRVMSWKNAISAAPKLELKLNLSPPRVAESSSPRQRSVSPPTTSPPSSCMSSESQQDDGGTEEATSMVLVGCPRCLMYVMLAEAKPKCPMCHSSVLLDVIYDHTKNNNART